MVSNSAYTPQNAVESKIFDSLFEGNLEMGLKTNYLKYTYMAVSIEDQRV